MIKPILIEQIKWEGKYLVDERGDRFLVEPSKEYIASRESIPEPIPEPTQEEYNMDFDFRLSMIELGL